MRRASPRVASFTHSGELQSDTSAAGVSVFPSSPLPTASYSPPACDVVLSITARAGDRRATSSLPLLHDRRPRRAARRVLRPRPDSSETGRVDLHARAATASRIPRWRRKRLDAVAEVVELAAQRVGLIVGRRIGDAVRELIELRGELVGDVCERVDALVAAALVVAAGLDARVQALNAERASVDPDASSSSRAERALTASRHSSVGVGRLSRVARSWSSSGALLRASSCRTSRRREASSCHASSSLRGDRSAHPAPRRPSRRSELRS